MGYGSNHLIPYKIMKCDIEMETQLNVSSTDWRSRNRTCEIEPAVTMKVYLGPSIMRVQLFDGH